MVPKTLTSSYFSLPILLNLGHILVRFYDIHFQASLNLPRFSHPLSYPYPNLISRQIVIKHNNENFQEGMLQYTAEEGKIMHIVIARYRKMSKTREM
jgi:hypothetical protein